MKINIAWDDAEETILVVHVIGNFNWGEIMEANKEAVAMVASKQHRCDVVYNLLDGKANSYGSALQNGRQIIRAFPDNMGILILVTQSLGRILLEPLKRLDPSIASKAFVAGRMDHALRIVKESRLTER